MEIKVQVAQDFTGYERQEQPPPPKGQVKNHPSGSRLFNQKNDIQPVACLIQEQMC